MDAHLTFEEIDPDIARVYLAKNIENNRNVVIDRVGQYARDMESGRWRETTETIKFDSEGNLIDGQHRLRAVVRAGVTVRFLVARGLANDAVYVIDASLPRNAAGGLRMTGNQIANISTVVASAHLINAYENGVFRHSHVQLGRADRMTVPESMEFVTDRLDELQSAAHTAASCRPHLLIPTSVIAAASAILARVDADAAKEFFEAIVSGQFGPNDPILILIRRTVSDKVNSRKVLPATQLFYIIRTWNAWRAGETLQRISTNSSSAPNVAMPTPV